MPLSSLNLILIGIFVRLSCLCLLEYSERLFQIPLTDVDYFVFSDASAFVSKGLSPYKRHTYRYTPLLAYALLPVTSFPPFGKLLFILFDLISAGLILKISGQSAALLYLFNPLTIGIAVRGNAEPIIDKRNTFSCQVKKVFGDGNKPNFSVHLKTYPAPWAVTVWLYYADKKLFGFIPYSKRGIIYGIISACTFLSLSWLSYSLFQEEFLEHAHLHHLSRQDTRHNFSIWFLSFYLMDGNSPYGFLCFLVQFALCLLISFKFSSDPFFASFLQTFVFVSFNKVITSQYFIWYLSLLPLVIKNLKMTSLRVTTLSALWFASQGFWLLPAYFFEMEGHNSFLWMHSSSIVHFATNIFIACQIINHYQPLHGKIKRN
uniref:GPI alpha-1,4-mannosyltransferase I, catalytic subunit n=1 Tax=Oikopleura dioica TaxID=34765 RepID=Q675P3_OIKDI|nr:mannosyltransferase-like protein [Oikopleura dioica]